MATDGWAETSSIRAVDLALSFEDAGVAAIVYTDIGRDGMLTGLNLDQTVALATAVATPVIASGGVGGPAGPGGSPAASPRARASKAL